MHSTFDLEACVGHGQTIVDVHLELAWTESNKRNVLRVNPRGVCYLARSTTIAATPGMLGSTISIIGIHEY